MINNMAEKFIAPCTKYYGCNPEALKLFSRDQGRVNFLECLACGSVWRDTTLCSEEGVYDKSYFDLKGYDKKFVHRTKKAHIFLAILEQFVNPSRLLEIGPGMGEVMQAAKQRGWQTMGLDISDYAVQRCNERGLPTQIGSLLDLPQDLGRYNAVFMKHILEHHRDPFKALEQTKKLLEPNGFLFIIVPNLDYKRAQDLREKHKFFNYDYEGRNHFVYFNPITLARALDHMGFEEVQSGFPTFLARGDSVYQFLQRNLRKNLPFLGYEQEIISISRLKQ